MKIVLAHDSFTQLGGAERVVLELARMYPDAPIYVLVADKAILAQLPESIQKRIRVSPLQWLYRVYHNFQHLLPFTPLAVRVTRIPSCDLLISSSSAFAKGFRKPKGSTHINYCHTPTRFLWTDQEYVVEEVPWLVRLPARIFLWWMKRWDIRAVGRVDIFLANSKEVCERIQKYYHRESEVVYPFVDIDFWKPSQVTGYRLQVGGKGGVVTDNQVSDLKPQTSNLKPKKGYFLIAGRLHAHKHNDLVVKACTEIGVELHVVGGGRDELHLKAIAGPMVKFLGRITDEQLRDEFSSAKAYIYPQLEDFGLMPVEAASCGTATIGIDEGGSKETIVPGQTGEWFSRGNIEELKSVLRTWDESKYSVEELRKHANKFSKERFIERISAVVSNINI